MAEPAYPRDLRGYGRNPPDPQWPGKARVAVQFVVNFEEGGENNILDGDRAVFETSIIIEYLQEHYPGPNRWIPGGDEGLRVRFRSSGSSFPPPPAGRARP